jgi:hypothetical protein
VLEVLCQQLVIKVEMEQIQYLVASHQLVAVEVVIMLLELV